MLRLKTVSFIIFVITIVLEVICCTSPESSDGQNTMLKDRKNGNTTGNENSSETSRREANKDSIEQAREDSIKWDKIKEKPVVKAYLNIPDSILGIYENIKMTPGNENISWFKARMQAIDTLYNDSIIQIALPFGGNGNYVRLYRWKENKDLLALSYCAHQTVGCGQVLHFFETKSLKPVSIINPIPAISSKYLKYKLEEALSKIDKSKINNKKDEYPAIKARYLYYEFAKNSPYIIAKLNYGDKTEIFNNPNQIDLVLFQIKIQSGSMKLK